MSILITTVEASNVVVTAGIGPRGPAGPPSEGLVYYAGTNLSGHKIFTINQDGLVIEASADNPLHQYTIGITTAAALEGYELQYINKGLLEHLGWILTPGLPVFLGLSGEVTQDIPPTAVFSKVIGLALTTTKINVEFQQAIFL